MPGSDGDIVNWLIGLVIVGFDDSMDDALFKAVLIGLGSEFGKNPGIGNESGIEGRDVVVAGDVVVVDGEGIV